MLSFPVLSAAKELATRGLNAKQKAALGRLPPPALAKSMGKHLIGGSDGWGSG
jgi:hypothetical protein